MRTSILFLSGLLVLTNAFTPSHPYSVSIRSGSRLGATVEVEADVTTKGLHKRDRYIATNRFAVRKDQQAKFEKRWATRKSRLATLPGFRYFHLMRRVDSTGAYAEGDSTETAQENYVSFTIWKKRSDFSAWRSGEAFKEAHGGTSIGAFLSTMVSSLRVLRGAPRPAFYDGLFLTKPSTPVLVPETVDGWRNVEANGIDTLPPECFVVLTKYFVSTDNAATFEKEYKQKLETDTTSTGLVLSSLMRRDGQAKGHGTVAMEPTEPTYVKTNVYQDRASFEATIDDNAQVDDVASELWKRSPETTFYEGTLVISCPEGA